MKASGHFPGHAGPSKSEGLARTKPFVTEAENLGHWGFDPHTLALGYWLPIAKAANLTT